MRTGPLRSALRKCIPSSNLLTPRRRLLCVFVLAAYIPQYLSIVAHGTRAISSRFVLFHSLSSTLTLALRLCHRVFYGAFNCVDGGPYTGWKAYSALLGFVQAAVQFIAAMIL